MKCLGVTAGIGSMQIGARQAGFNIIGNIEWRPYYHFRDLQGRNTWEENFKAPLWKSIKDVPEDIKKSWDEPEGQIDLVMGHPECGNFSLLRGNRDKCKKDPADIPLFADLVKWIKPRFFVMDNLGPSLEAFTAEDWAARLPDYDLFPEWVSNYNYGNVQKMRRRFFMIGALKEEGFTFVPGEEEFNGTLRDAIGSLPNHSDEAYNHVHHKPDQDVHGWSRHHFVGNPNYHLINPDKKDIPLRIFQQLIKGYKSRANFPYVNLKGESKSRPGYSKVVMDHPAPVQCGGGFAAFDNHYREDTLRPLTIRERARIQGCPDDFIFYPRNPYESKKSYPALIKQTGKFMPVQFCEYVSRQIMAHIKGEDFIASGKRLIPPNKYVEAARAKIHPTERKRNEY